MTSKNYAELCLMLWRKSSDTQIKWVPLVGGGKGVGEEASNDLMHSIRFYSGSTHQPSLPRKIERLREVSRGLRTFHNVTTNKIIIFS